MADIDWKHLFLSFEGRIGRRDYWIATILVILIHQLLSLIPFFGLLLSCFAAWPLFAINAKRLHDIGRTGWLQLLYPAVMFICLILTIILSDLDKNDDGTAMIPLAIIPLFALIFTLWVGLSRGNDGSNPYGPPPYKPHPELA